MMSSGNSIPVTKNMFSHRYPDQTQIIAALNLLNHLDLADVTTIQR